ncbi:hypothetical protein KR52_11995 [Synechococcus sp. KORDI-52]|nr:hypothetical protein KR52_11995 [Synechococcus sp. KORDI-52]
MVIMGEIPLLVLVACLPMKMQILGAWALDFLLATAHIPRLLTGSGVIFLNVLILIARFCLRIILVRQHWPLQQRSQQDSWQECHHCFLH